MTDEIECALQGRLTADPVKRTSAKGKDWLSMNVAVGSGDAVQFVSIALFGDGVAEATARLHKGERIYCEGKIKLNQWQDKEGRERSGLSVASFNVVPLGQIGKRRPAKPKTDAGNPDGDRTSGTRPRSPSRQQRDAAARADWQRPAGSTAASAKVEIPIPF